MADPCRYRLRSIALGAYDTHAGCREEFDRRCVERRYVRCGEGERGRP